jgi:putative membrane protein
MRRVQTHWSLVGLAVSLALSAYFVATQPITPALAIVSSISVVLFALPSYLAVVRAKGRGKGALLLLCLGLYALAIESSALATGFPYGDFTYTDVLGNKVLGLTPWTVAFAYPPLLLLSFVVARRLTDGLATTHRLAALLGLTALLTVACDLVLDPAAVRLGFWYWDEPGKYYGVPFVNFAGWALSGLVGALLLWRSWGGRSVPAAVSYSGLATVWFWTAVNAWLGQWIPAAFGIALSSYLWRTLRQVAAGRKEKVQ